MSGDCLESIICSIPGLCCIITPVLLLKLLELVLGGLSTIISGTVAGFYIWFLTGKLLWYHASSEYISNYQTRLKRKTLLIIFKILSSEFGPHYLSNDDFQQQLNSLAILRNFDNGSFTAENNSKNTVGASFAVSVIGAIIYSIHFFDSILLIVGRQLGKYLKSHRYNLW